MVWPDMRTSLRPLPIRAVQVLKLVAFIFALILTLAVAGDVCLLAEGAIQRSHVRKTDGSVLPRPSINLIGACDNPPRPEEEYWLTRTNVCDIFTDHD